MNETLSVLRRVSAVHVTHAKGAWNVAAQFIIDLGTRIVCRNPKLQESYEKFCNALEF